MAAKPKARTKKYDPKAKERQSRERALRLADVKIRSALKGVMVAYNSSWGEKEDFVATGLDKILALLKGDEPMTYGLIAEIAIRWRFYITINCQDEWGTNYIYALPVLDKVGQLVKLEDEIEDDKIKKALESRNKNHVLDWGYWGEIV